MYAPGVTLSKRCAIAAALTVGDDRQMGSRRYTRHRSYRPRLLRFGRGIGWLLTVVMVAACSSGNSSVLVADELGDSVAVHVVGALRSATRLVSTEPIERATANLPDAPPLPDGVERLEIGRWIDSYADERQAQFAAVFAVVPVEESEEPYCVAVTVHSSGQVAARPASGDALDACADVPLIDLLDV